MLTEELFDRRKNGLAAYKIIKNKTLAKYKLYKNIYYHFHSSTQIALEWFIQHLINKNKTIDLLNFHNNSSNDIF